MTGTTEKQSDQNAFVMKVRISLCEHKIHYIPVNIKVIFHNINIYVCNIIYIHIY